MNFYDRMYKRYYIHPDELKAEAEAYREKLIQEKCTKLKNILDEGISRGFQQGKTKIYPFLRDEDKQVIECATKRMIPR